MAPEEETIIAMPQGAERVPPGDATHRHAARPAADIFWDPCCFCDWHPLRIRSERVLRVETRPQDSSPVCDCVQPPPQTMINVFSALALMPAFSGANGFL